MQNWGHGNDMAAASLYLSTHDAAATVVNNTWAGGVNVTALEMVRELCLVVFLLLLFLYDFISSSG